MGNIVSILFICPYDKQNGGLKSKKQTQSTF